PCSAASSFVSDGGRYLCPLSVRQQVPGLATEPLSIGALGVDRRHCIAGPGEQRFQLRRGSAVVGGRARRNLSHAVAEAWDARRTAGIAGQVSEALLRQRLAARCRGSCACPSVAPRSRGVVKQGRAYGGWLARDRNAVARLHGRATSARALVQYV